MHALYWDFSGAACFFVKRFSSSYTARGYCFKDTGQIQSNGSWGNLSFLGFSYYNCLDPAAQFRFRDNGAMLNLKRRGCLAAFHMNGSGYDLDMFYLYVDSVSLDKAACAQKPNEGIYRAIKQTPHGRLSVFYKGKDKSSFETWCGTHTSAYETPLYKNYRIGYAIGLTTPCERHYSTRFIFGKCLLNNIFVRDFAAGSFLSNKLFKLIQCYTLFHTTTSCSHNVFIWLQTILNQTFSKSFYPVIYIVKIKFVIMTACM